VRSTKLILLEGIPGSGKSTMAQHLARGLTDESRNIQWWYEEMHSHPLSIFDDVASLNAVIQEFRDRQFANLIAKAEDRWDAFAGSLADFTGVVIVDRTFLGYLTWTLFAFDAPKE
jgi:thymidylate kinase